MTFLREHEINSYSINIITNKQVIIKTISNEQNTITSYAQTQVLKHMSHIFLLHCTLARFTTHAISPFKN